MRIEVAYARPDQQYLLSLDLPAGSTLSDALAAAGLAEHCPELAGGEFVVGIWGQIEKSPKTRLLQAGDRVEVYRPLTVDPMVARKARADKVRQQRVGDA
ncbi:MAG: RnfH family protein [Pseudomonadota bacterium]